MGNSQSSPPPERKTKPQNAEELRVGYRDHSTTNIIVYPNKPPTNITAPPSYSVATASSAAGNSNSGIRVSGSSAGQSNVFVSSAGKSNVSGSSAGQSNNSGSSASGNTNSETPRTKSPVNQTPSNSSSNQSTADSGKKNEETFQNNSNPRRKPIPPSRIRNQKNDSLSHPGATQPHSAGTKFQSPATKQTAGQSFTRGPQNMGGSQNMGHLQSVGGPQNVNPSIMNPPSIGMYLQMPSVPSISIGPPPNMSGHPGNLMNPHIMPVNNPPPPHMITAYPRVPSPQDYMGPPLALRENAIPPLMPSNNSSRFENQRGRQWNQKSGPAKFNNNFNITNDLDTKKLSPPSTSENKTSNLGEGSSKVKNFSGGNKGKRGDQTDLWKELENLKIKIKNENSSKKKLSSEISDLMVKVATASITSKESFIQDLSDCLQQVNKMSEEDKVEDSERNPRRSYKTNFKKHTSSRGFSSSGRTERDYQGSTSEDNQGRSHQSSNFHRGRGGFRGNYNNRRPQGPDGEDEASNRNRPYYNRGHSHHRFPQNANNDNANEQQSDDDNCSDVASQHSEPSTNRRNGGNFRGNHYHRRGSYQQYGRGQGTNENNGPQWHPRARINQDKREGNNEQSDDDNGSDDATSISSEPPHNNRRNGGNFRGKHYHRRGGYQQHGKDQRTNEQSDDDNASDDAASMCSEPPNNNRRRGGGGRFRGRGHWRGQWKKRGNSRSGNLRKATSEDALTQENDNKQKEDEDDQNEQEEKLIDFASEDEGPSTKEDKNSYASEEIMNLFIGKEIPSLMDAILAKINVMLKVKNCIMIAHEAKGIVKEKPETLLDIIQFKELYQDAVVLNEQ